MALEFLVSSPSPPSPLTLYSQCCHHYLETMGTKFLMSFILVLLNRHKKLKDHLSSLHSFHIAFTCQIFQISLLIPLLLALLTPTPEIFLPGPLEVIVICKIPYILNQLLLKCSFPFSMVQSFLVITFLVFKD